MSICIAIKESELEEVAGLLDGRFVYKFLFDSSNKDEYHTEDLKIKKLRDCIMFSGFIQIIRSLKVKTQGNEIRTAVKKLSSGIFDEERHLAVVNDYVNNPYLVIVFTDNYIDTSQSQKSMNITIPENVLNEIIKNITSDFLLFESMKVISMDLYKSGMIHDTKEEYDAFINRQKQLVKMDQNKFKEDLIKHFNEAFKFRLITYYSKLREYSLDELMKQLMKLGYLDERFYGDCDIYEDEARKILARRLCTISFKKDIEILIKKGIMSPEMIQYSIGLDI